MLLLRKASIPAICFLLFGCNNDEHPLQVTTDPEFNLPDSCVLLDHFEDISGTADQIILTELQSSQKGSVPQPPEGIWLVYHNDSSKALAPAGEKLVPYDAIEAGSQSNFSLAVGPWGKDGNGVHMKWYLKGSDYPYIGFGTSFNGKFNVDWFNFSTLTAVSFWAKGSGEVRACMTTDTIQNGYGPNDNWGHFARDFTLDSDWTYYHFAVEEFEPKPWSLAESDGLVWSDGMKKVCFFEIQSSQYYDRVADDTLEIFVDDIRLHGLSYEVFGLSRP